MENCYICNNKSATAFVDGKSYTIDANSGFFQKAVNLLHEETEESYKAFATLCDKQNNIKEWVGGYKNIEIKNDGIYFKKHRINNDLTEKILNLRKEGKKFTRFALFLDKMVVIESKELLDVVFDFAARHGLAINNEGFLIVYKVVASDYTDYFSRSIDNSVGGKIPRLSRLEVDDDRRQACSYGYHVGSLTYSGPNGWFQSGDPNRHVMICKVNPADIVSIPNDVTQDKIRVCYYEVIDEYEKDLDFGYGEDKEDCFDCSEYDGETCCMDPEKESLSESEYNVDCDDLYEGDTISFYYDKKNGKDKEKRYCKVVDFEYNEKTDNEYVVANSIEPDKKAGEENKLFIKDRMSNIRYFQTN